MVSDLQLLCILHARRKELISYVNSDTFILYKYQNACIRIQHFLKKCINRLLIYRKTLEEKTLLLRNCQVSPTKSPEIIETEIDPIMVANGSHIINVRNQSGIVFEYDAVLTLEGRVSFETFLCGHSTCDYVYYDNESEAARRLTCEMAYLLLKLEGTLKRDFIHATALCHLCKTGYF